MKNQLEPWLLTLLGLLLLVGQPLQVVHASPTVVGGGQAACCCMGVDERPEVGCCCCGSDLDRGSKESDGPGLSPAACECLSAPTPQPIPRPERLQAPVEVSLVCCAISGTWLSWEQEGRERVALGPQYWVRPSTEPPLWLVFAAFRL